MEAIDISITLFRGALSRLLYTDSSVEDVKLLSLELSSYFER